jgi:putative membrane protein
VTSPRRWPGWVYGSGEEPDYRFSFANERTFLAWVRTSLALLAAGVALDAVTLSIAERTQHLLALGLVVLGIVSAAMAWVRWARAERAMRSKGPLPAFGWGAVFALAVVLVGLVLVAVAF